MKVRALRSTLWHGNPDIAGQPAITKGKIYTIVETKREEGQHTFKDTGETYEGGVNWYALKEIDGWHHDKIFEEAIVKDSFYA